MYFQIVYLLSGLQRRRPPRSANLATLGEPLKKSQENLFPMRIYVCKYRVHIEYNYGYKDIQLMERTRVRTFNLFSFALYLAQQSYK